MNHVARNILWHETSSSSTCATSHDGGRLAFLSLLLSFSLSLLLLLSLSLLVRTTHVQAIRYDWPDPRFRTNHFIKAVLNKPAFDYTPRHLVVIVSYTSSFLRTLLLSTRSASTEKNYVYRVYLLTCISQNSLGVPLHVCSHKNFLVDVSAIFLYTPKNLFDADKSFNAHKGLYLCR